MIVYGVAGWENDWCVRPGFEDCWPVGCSLIRSLSQRPDTARSSVLADRRVIRALSGSVSHLVVIARCWSQFTCAVSLRRRLPVQVRSQLSASLQGLVDRFGGHLLVWPVKVFACQSSVDLAAWRLALFQPIGYRTGQMWVGLYCARFGPGSSWHGSLPDRPGPVAPSAPTPGDLLVDQRAVTARQPSDRPIPATQPRHPERSPRFPRTNEHSTPHHAPEPSPHRRPHALLRRGDDSFTSSFTSVRGIHFAVRAN